MKKVTFIAVLLLLIMVFSENVYADISSLLSEKKLIDASEIVSRLGTGKVKVLVNLTRPALLESTNWNSQQSVQTLQDKVLLTQTLVMSKLNQTNFKLRNVFENQAAFSCEVDINVLQQLIDDSRVVSISPVRILEPHLKQGIPLIDPGNAREDYYGRNYNGKGIAIAICDTGIDYRHPMLQTKVIGGYDFGNKDNNFIPVGEAHGTCCAGIAAGSIPPSPVDDYIGGVAFNAKLYALKISPDNAGYAYEDDMISAWDWCVTHKNDDPENPIMVISTSFGGGRHMQNCDTASPAMTEAANNAVDAGITLLVSSGNDGYCDSISWPACISSVISVGAVYDKDFGAVGFFLDESTCAKVTVDPNYPPPAGYVLVIDNTGADVVTSYSNSAGILDVFAPSHNAYTTDIVGEDGYAEGDYSEDFGGTSAACPYAAGVVACLQQAAMDFKGYYLSPEEVRDVISSTGKKIMDQKTNDPNYTGEKIEKPRVDLSAAIYQLPHDIFEDDNVVSQAKSISTIGTIQEHSIIPETDVDWMKFYITSDSNVVIETNSVGTLDTEMWLYDSESNLLKYDDNGGKRGSSKIQIVIHEGGLYSLKVSQKPGTAGQVYWYGVSVKVTPRSADIQYDSIVNFEDYAKLALWLPTMNCADNNECNDLDLDFSKSIDTGDLKVVADNWLNVGVPELVLAPISGANWLISKYEITNRQYCAYLNMAYPDDIKVVKGIIYEVNDVNNATPLFDTYNYDTYSQIVFTGDSFYVRTKDGQNMDHHPVVMVSWYGASAFCHYYGCSLPTEDQWELASRGWITVLDFPWGVSWQNENGNCWDSTDNFEIGPWPWTSPVYELPEQNYNYLNDMAGNVWEWTNSSYSGYYILRGGSWYSHGDDCEIANRIGSDPGSRYFHYGFRVCLGNPLD